MESFVLHRKDSLILTAIEILEELGIQGLSTREIARRQGVSEATLFRHYKTKNDLLLAVLDYESKYDSDIIASVRLKKLGLRDSIIYYINSFAEYYENYPAVTAISQAYDVLASDPFLAGKIKESFFTRISFLQEIVTDAREKGEISDEIDGKKFSFLIWGAFRSICLNWRFLNYSFPLKQYTLSTLEMTLNAFEIK